MATTHTHNPADSSRLLRAKAKPDKPKSKFTGKLKATTPPKDQKPVPESKQDQKGTPEPAKQDQKRTKPAKPRKDSATVIAWKKLKNFPPEAKITILGDYATNNPKRRDAARRFSFYKNGMTVKQYLDITNENGISNGLANMDIRWDVAAGWISVK